MSNILGIDVGMGSCKLVSLSKTEKGLVLDSIGEVENPRPDWLSAGGKAMDEVTVAIKAMITDLKINAKQVVSCVSEDSVVSRLIRLPPLKDNEIKDALTFEAETFVPYPLDQVSIDYEIIERDDAGRLTVFAIAARNDLINSYIKLFKNLNLELVALESPAIAFRRVVADSVSADAGVLLVDMGEKYSDIIGINKGNVYFTRSMPTGGESLTRAISINLKLDMASAEEYKKAYGMKELELEGKIKLAIEPVFASISDEIRKSMSLFSEEVKTSANLLVLSGGGANLPGFAEELTKILGIEVQVIQPFLRIDSSRLVLPFNLTSEGCRFSLAVGMALRGML